MEDAEGRFIDFKNTLILLTTNVATERIITLCQDPELLPTPDGLARAVREPLLAAFPAALLGRLVTIPYYPLSHAILADIVRLQLDRIARRIGDHHKIAFTYDTEVVDHGESLHGIRKRRPHDRCDLDQYRAAQNQSGNPHLPAANKNDQQGSPEPGRWGIYLCLCLTGG